MKKITLWCVAALLTLMLLPMSAQADALNYLTPPKILSLDIETLAVAWDEPDKPGAVVDDGRHDMEGALWEYVGGYELRVYYADHALTDEEFNYQHGLPIGLSYLDGHRIGGKGNPSGMIDRKWLTNGNGFYYFGVVALTTRNGPVFENGVDVCENSSPSTKDRPILWRTPYELTDVETLPAPSGIRYADGQLRWTYDRELFAQAEFHYDFYTPRSGHSEDHRMVDVFYDEGSGESVVALVNGMNWWNLIPDTTYNLVMWAEAKDPTAYGKSKKTYQYSFLKTAADRLPQPGNAVFDQDNLQLRWDPVADAGSAEYEANVYYGDGTSIRQVGRVRTENTQLSLNEYALQYGSGTYYAVIQSYSKDFTKWMDSKSGSIPSLSDPAAWDEVPHGTLHVSDTPLPTISLSGLSWGEDGFLRWEAVPGAVGYEVREYRRSSDSEEFMELRPVQCPVPACRLFSPDSYETGRQSAIRVRALSGDALQNAHGAWSELSPVYVVQPVPELPRVKRHYDKKSRTISWDLITGEDAAYVGGYVVEINFNGTDKVGNSITIHPGWTVLTEGNTVSSVSLDAFAKYLGTYEGTGEASFSVWAYSNDLSARNHGRNSSASVLPDGALESLGAAPRVAVTDVQRGDGDCTFRVSLSGDYEGATLFAAAYESSGKLRTVRVLDAAETMPVTLAGLEKDDVIRVMLADENSKPLAPVTPVE